MIHGIVHFLRIMRIYVNSCKFFTFVQQTLRFLLFSGVFCGVLCYVLTVLEQKKHFHLDQVKRPNKSRSELGGATDLPPEGPGRILIPTAP